MIDIIIGEVSVEMRDWLDENYSGKYRIRPHIVRFRWAGPQVPISKCQRPEGSEIWFQNDEDALAFKLTWL